MASIGMIRSILATSEQINTLKIICFRFPRCLICARNKRALRRGLFARVGILPRMLASFLSRQDVVRFQRAHLRRREESHKSVDPKKRPRRRGGPQWRTNNVVVCTRSYSIAGEKLVFRIFDSVRFSEFGLANKISAEIRRRRIIIFQRRSQKSDG